MNGGRVSSFMHLTKIFNRSWLKLNRELSPDPHHRQCEGLLLQVLSSVTQDKRKDLHCLSQPHFISQDPTRPLCTHQRKLSN